MCGIVGLLLKQPALRPKLGELMAPMLIGMTSRGPDSAGVAIFGDPLHGDNHKISLLWGEGEVDWKRLAQEFTAEFEGRNGIQTIGGHAVIATQAVPAEVRDWLADAAPQSYVLSVGKSIDLYKDIGAPAEID